jgi:hypothetical protein
MLALWHRGRSLTRLRRDGTAATVSTSTSMDSGSSLGPRRRQLLRNDCSSEIWRFVPFRPSSFRSRASGCPHLPCQRRLLFETAAPHPTQSRASRLSPRGCTFMIPPERSWRDPGKMYSEAHSAKIENPIQHVQSEPIGSHLSAAASLKSPRSRAAASRVFSIDYRSGSQRRPVAILGAVRQHRHKPIPWPCSLRRGLSISVLCARE